MLKTYRILEDAPPYSQGQLVQLSDVHAARFRKAEEAKSKELKREYKLIEEVDLTKPPEPKPEEAEKTKTK